MFSFDDVIMKIRSPGIKPFCMKLWVQKISNIQELMRQKTKQSNTFLWILRLDEILHKTDPEKWYIEDKNIAFFMLRNYM